jgi:hypothetical protein
MNLPFITPTSTAISKHSIPCWSIALTPVSCDSSAIDGPAAQEIINNTTAYNRKPKGSPIKRVIQHLIRIPAAASEITKRPTNFRLIDRYSVRIYPKERSRAIFLADPTARLVTSAVYAHLVEPLGQDVEPAPRTKQAEILQTKTPVSVSLIHFCFIKHKIGITGKILLLIHAW